MKRTKTFIRDFLIVVLFIVSFLLYIVFFVLYQEEYEQDGRCKGNTVEEKNSVNESISYYNGYFEEEQKIKKSISEEEMVFRTIQENLHNHYFNSLINAFPDKQVKPLGTEFDLNQIQFTERIGLLIQGLEIDEDTESLTESQIEFEESIKQIRQGEIEEMLLVSPNYSVVTLEKSLTNNTNPLLDKEPYQTERENILSHLFLIKTLKTSGDEFTKIESKNNSIEQADQYTPLPFPSWTTHSSKPSNPEHLDSWLKDLKMKKIWYARLDEKGNFICTGDYNYTSPSFLSSEICVEREANHKSEKEEEIASTSCETEQEKARRQWVSSHHTKPLWYFEKGKGNWFKDYDRLDIEYKQKPHNEKTDNGNDID